MPKNCPAVQKTEKVWHFATLSAGRNGGFISPAGLLTTEAKLLKLWQAYCCSSSVFFGSRPNLCRQPVKGTPWLASKA